MTNASVTLPSDEFTMPVRCPKSPFPGDPTIIVRIHGHRSLYDFV